MTDTHRATTNARPLDETIAGTGPGIADDALGVGEEMLEAPTDAEVGAAARALGADVPAAGLANASSAPLHPGDVAPEGTPGTGEDVCRVCNGSGTVGGEPCAECGGTGIVVEGIGGG